MMDFLINAYNYFGNHPLFWQALVAAGITSHIFEWIKRKLALEGKGRITLLLSIVSAVTVAIHVILIGASFNPTLFGTQTLAYIGVLNLVYNFVTTKVTKLLQDAYAAANTPPALKTALNDVTPLQKNQASAQASPAASDGVAEF